MTDQQENAAAEPPLDVSALVVKWADDNHVGTVNRSYGAQTTAPVTVAALESLVRAAMAEEREACAKIADARAMRCEKKTELAEDADEATELRSLAWQFSVLAAEMRKRPIQA